MKKTNKKQAAAWLLSLLPLVMIAAVYRRLPAEVPIHWDLDGAVDYGAKAQLWVIAAMAPVLEAMFCFLPKIDPNGLSLKMLKICSLLIEDGTLRPFSIRWPKSAIISNTDCLIHASTAFRKTGNASTLSLIDILEPRVDEKYFLSPQATARLLYS